VHTVTVRNHPLFQGLSEEELTRAMAFFSAVYKSYRRGDSLNRYLSPLPAFGLVLEGTVQVYMDDIDGHPLILANVSPGDTFGESLSYLELDAPISIRAETDARILWLSSEKLKGRTAADDLEHLLIRRFIAMLARRTLSMNDRIQILSKRTLRAKLVTFFSQYMQKYGSAFTLPFDRNSMAIYLGTERSALSRELARMKQDGLIRYERNQFTILTQMET